MTVKGIDVASYQSPAYSTAGQQFVIVKATEGTGYINPRHDAQVAHGRSSGLVIGHYHFVRPGSISAQAAYFLAHAKAVKGDILVLDWEDTGVSGASKDTWLALISALRPTYQNLLYCNKDFWFNRDKTGRYGTGLWIADPANSAGHPGVQAPWTFHQYAVSGGYDRNVGNFTDMARLVDWTHALEPDPVPPPPPPPTPTPTPKPGGTVTTNAEQLDGGLLRIGEVGTVDPKTPSGRQEHALPYYVAKGYHLQKVVADQVSQQTVLLTEIRDALTQSPVANAQAQTEHAAALTDPQEG